MDNSQRFIYICLSKGNRTQNSFQGHSSSRIFIYSTCLTVSTLMAPCCPNVLYRAAGQSHDFRLHVQTGSDNGHVEMSPPLVCEHISTH